MREKLLHPSFAKTERPPPSSFERSEKHEKEKVSEIENNQKQRQKSVRSKKASLQLWYVVDVAVAFNAARQFRSADLWFVGSITGDAQGFERSRTKALTLVRETHPTVRDIADTDLR